MAAVTMLIQTEERKEQPLVTGFLTFSNRRSEDIRVEAIVITELELGHIEGHILFAHLVESADNAALEDRPEAFDGLRVLQAGQARGNQDQARHSECN